MRSCLRILMLTTILVVFALPGVAAQKARTEPTKKSVRILYLVPKDRHHRKDYQKAIETCALELQTWYYGHLNGKTFHLSDPIVEVKQTVHDAGWYDSNIPENNPERSLYQWYNTLNDAAALLGVKVNDPDYVWVIYIDSPGPSGLGTPGVALLPEHDLQGLIGNSTSNPKILSWTGEMGTNLGMHSDCHMQVLITLPP